MTVQSTNSTAAPAALGYGEVQTPVADLRAESRDDAERVNQALLATPLEVLDTHTDAAGDAWLRVRLPDYTGWMRAEAVAWLETPPAPGRQMRVTVPRTALRILDDSGAASGETVDAFMGSTLTRVADAPPMAGEGLIVVHVPGGREALADPAALTPVDAAAAGNAEAIIESARAFMTTPYLWGGMTCQGIDCSGLTQIAYRVHGYTLPRDADEQFRQIPQHVEIDELQPGDLLFFGKDPNHVTHVTMYVGEGQMIHASGSATRVLVQSLDPTHPEYHGRRDTYLGARRVLGAAPRTGA
jgi:gamma-D-glutamyl-L-lysine dipeptidyl-peptidase